MNNNIRCCPKCSSCFINYQFVQENAKTKTNNVSILSRLGRALLVLCTCGLWLLVPKRKSTSKTNIRSRKMAICNTCGYSWEVK